MIALHAPLVERLAASSIGRTFNQYVEGPRSAFLRTRLAAYLDEKRDARILLVGEAAGYRGARVSGIPFTSERQLSGSGPAEATATIVHRVLSELLLEDKVLLWNVVPTHPGDASSNRAPTRAEVEAGLRFVGAARARPLRDRGREGGTRRPRRRVRQASVSRRRAGVPSGAG